MLRSDAPSSARTKTGPSAVKNAAPRRKRQESTRARTAAVSTLLFLRETDMDLIYYTVLTLAWAVGGFLSGITSMGCALIALPILNMVMSPEQAVLNSCVCAGVIAAVLVMLHHRGILFRELLLLLGASLPGSVFGVLLFECVSAAWLNMALGVVLWGITAFLGNLRQVA